MSQFSLRARWVVPVDTPPIEHGVVSIAGERIVSVGTSTLTETIDLGDVVLLPGLINAHTHLEFSDCDRPLGQRHALLPEWIRQVIGTRHRADRNTRDVLHCGLIESLRSGVTAIGEISTAPHSAYAESYALNLVLFQEVIGFSAGRIDSVYGDLKSRVEGALGSGFAVGISPHAPYTVHPTLLRRLIAFASQHKLPVAMHLAESREELEFLQYGTGPFQQLLADRSMWDAGAIPRGSRPLDYLHALADAPRALIIHGNYLDDDEIGFLAAHRERMSVIFCPRTHAYFGHEDYPLGKMLEAEVRVVLGTDSRASNPDLNVLAEMQFLAEQFRDLEPARILRMATMSAATALALQNEIGSLTSGKFADLVALPCGAATDPFDAILNAKTAPACVYVRGRQLHLD